MVGSPPHVMEAHRKLTAHQLREAFPWDTAPRYLLRDRDRIFGSDFVEQVKAMGIKRICQISFFSWRRALGAGLPRPCKPLKIQETFTAEEAQQANFLPLMNEF